ncbi:MAG: hypothetical protein HND55_03765 [Pseudomonadota bacterium]|nr:MAG: hypothetical protein HND55_03765 [Pseudomonadota bacterium]
MASRQASKTSRLRREVAAEAARIMATEGQRSFLAAKQKAARRMGISPRAGLPSNSEVDQALRDWQQLYGGDAHAANLYELRRSALSAMRLFESFRPRLVGPVLDGTADEHSRISLHVFADDPDAVVRFLIERHLPFQQESRRIRWHDGCHREVDVLVIEGGGSTVELLQMIGRDALQAPPSPVDGRSQRRMAASELERLLASSDQAPGT